MGRNEQIIALRKDGVGPREIARRLELTPSVVAGVLHRAGLTDPDPQNGGHHQSNASLGYRAWAVGLLERTSAREAGRIAQVSGRTLTKWRSKLRATA